MSTSTSETVSSQNTPSVSEAAVGSSSEKEVVTGYLRSFNPEILNLPKTYQRVRHGSHCHNLFYGFGQRNHRCDNLGCRREIPMAETRFFCQRCDFDLCARCFALPATQEVELKEDDKDIDVLVLPTDLLSVTVQTSGGPSCYEDGEDR